MRDTVLHSRGTRRDFIGGLAALTPIVGLAGSLGPLTLSSSSAIAADDTAADKTAADGVSHAAEAIHHEILVQGRPERVYAALADARQFDKIIDLSGIRQSTMLPADANKPTQISPEAGTAFTLFGGFITGRQIELVPNVRIVQAWRAMMWGPGVFSIAKFELLKQGAATKLVFDHTGFPKGAGKGLAAGWHKNYWEPLKKLLAQSKR